MDRAVRAFVGLGANLGDAADAIAGALAALGALPDTRLAGVSSLYRSAPIDADGGEFLNAVAALDTALAPQPLLDALLGIERAHGRVRPQGDGGPRPARSPARPLDLDLLLWDAVTLDTPGLVLPHPRMHLRAFVLAPLAELAPGLQLPGRPPVAELLRACASQQLAIALPAAALRATADRHAEPAR